MAISTLFSTLLWAGFGMSLLAVLGEYLAFLQTRRGRYHWPSAVNLLRKSQSLVLVVWAGGASVLFVEAPHVLMYGLIPGLLALMPLVLQYRFVTSWPRIRRNAVAIGSIGGAFGALLPVPSHIPALPATFPLVALLACFGAGGFLVLLAGRLDTQRQYELVMQG